MSGAGGAREYLCAARDAAALIVDYERRVSRARDKCGLRARNLESSSHGAVLDAMRHVDALVDMEEAAPRELRDAVSEVADAARVLFGVARAGSPAWARVLRDRYLLLRPWGEVARMNGMATSAEAEQVADVAVDWLDSLGVARAREIWGEFSREVWEEL